jgi:glucose-1-phosphate cytidylyltransferase
MKHFAFHGLREFYVALGYRGEVIKRYFLDYYSLAGSMTIDFSSGQVLSRERECEDWTVHLEETGPRTMTGGRLRAWRPRCATAPSC